MEGPLLGLCGILFMFIVLFLFNIPAAFTISTGHANSAFISSLSARP